MEIKTLLDEYCQYATFIKGYSKNTIKRYQSLTNFFLKHTQITRFDEINEKLIFSFMMYGRIEREWSP